jgi:hypothetical protein
MSHKNTLQEYCQKHKIAFPIYKTHPPTNIQEQNWTATVSCYNHECTSIGNFLKIREAEQNAAKQMYEFITRSMVSQPALQSVSHVQSVLQPVLQPVPQPVPQTVLPNKYHIFIDLENIQPVIPDRLLPIINIYCFLSSFSAVDIEKYKNVANIYIIDNNGSDATDHFMSYKAGELSVNIPKTDIFIVVSRDKSSGVLTHILSTAGYRVEHYKNSKTFEQFIGRFIERSIK